MSETRNFLYLSETALAGLGITTKEAVDAIEHLIRGQGEDKVWSAPKAVVQPPDGRYLMATLAAADEPPLMSVKSLLINPANPERGLKQINAMVTLLDSDTGLPRAVMDGNWITAVRTAALSAVAAKRLARPDTHLAAFIGCGVQAESHLRAFAELYPLREIRAFGRGRTNIDALCRTAEGRGLAAAASATARDAVTDADLIVTSITMTAPVDLFLDAGWLKPGAFAAVTDLAVPWIKDSRPKFDRIVIDDMEQEASMPNKLAPADLIAGDLSQLVRGGIDGRTSDEERTAFIFRAHPLGDLALAALAYQKATDDGRGKTIET